MTGQLTLDRHRPPQLAFGYGLATSSDGGVLTTGKLTGRVVAVVALMILAASALRGYLPAPHHRPRVSEEGDSPAALMFLIAAIAATLALLAFAIIFRLRDPRASAPSAGDLSGMLGSGVGARPSWRVILIIVAAVIAWLLVVLAVSRMITPPDVNLDAPKQDSTGQPSRPGTAPPPKQRPRHQNNGDPLGLVLLSTAPLILVFVAGVIVATRRRGRPAQRATVAADKVELPTPATQSLVRAAEVGLAEMTDLSREPREAIIACYAAMERELANVPGAAPQEYDTPTEVLARAVERHALQADNAVQLVNLFEEARFSPHVMNEAHREVATQVLELVLHELAPQSGRAI